MERAKESESYTLDNVVCRSIFKHSPETWEEHRLHIRKLFLEEGKSISEVIQFLRAENLFHVGQVLSN